MNLTLKTDEKNMRYRKNKDMVKKNYVLVREATNELEISEMRPVDDKISLNNGEQKENTKQEQKSKNDYNVKEEVSKSNIVSENLSKKNNENHMNDAKIRDNSRTSSNLEINSEPKSVDQATGIIVKEANVEPYKERVYIEQVTKVYPIEEVTLIYASEDDEKEIDDVQNQNQEYQDDQIIPSSSYFALEKYENEVKQNVENYKDDSAYQANDKEADSRGYIISDKLNFESAEFYSNLRRDKQYSPAIKQVMPNTQLNKKSDNEITKIYEIPHKLQIGHEKYLRPQESQLKPEYPVTKGPPINHQAILENPIISNENVQIGGNQGAKVVENPNLADFHVIDTEKDLEVPDGVEGPVPAVALPPPSNRRGYIAVPFTGKQI